MNLLSLVGPRLDNICQIRRKWYYLSGWNFLQSKRGKTLISSSGIPCIWRQVSKRQLKTCAKWQTPCLFGLISRISSHPAVFFSHNKPANSAFSIINQRNEQAENYLYSKTLISSSGIPCIWRQLPCGQELSRKKNCGQECSHALALVKRYCCSIRQVRTGGLRDRIRGCLVGAV
jgi:hypothetical protein